MIADQVSGFGLHFLMQFWTAADYHRGPCTALRWPKTGIVLRHHMLPVRRLRRFSPASRLLPWMTVRQELLLTKGQINRAMGRQSRGATAARAAPDRCSSADLAGVVRADALISMVHR